MVILGIDPGFAALGYAVVRIAPGGVEIPIAAGVARTAKASKKQNIYAADDNMRRVRELSDAIRELMRYEPALICAESQSWPRNASATAKVGMAWGVVGALAGDVPIRQVSPQDLKLATAGSKSASKTDVERVILDRWPVLELMLEDAEKTPPGLWNHAFDAAGAILACMDSELVRAVLQLRA